MSDDIIKRLRSFRGPFLGDGITNIHRDEIIAQLDAAREAARTWENEAERRSRRYEECAIKLDAAEAENERLRLFAGNVLERSREEFTDVSCGDIEDFARRFGLLEQVTMTAACGDDCQCAEWADFPLECLRPTALGSAAIDAARREK